jgi:hypothetical protein
MHQSVRHGIEVAVDGDVVVDVDARHEPAADDKRRRRQRLQLVALDRLEQRAPASINDDEPAVARLLAQAHEAVLYTFAARIATRTAASCLRSGFMADGLAGSDTSEGTGALAETACRPLGGLGAHRVRPGGRRAGTGAERALSERRCSRHQRHALTGLRDS